METQGTVMEASGPSNVNTGIQRFLSHAIAYKVYR